MIKRVGKILNISIPEAEDGDDLRLASGATVPTDGTAGYVTGCLFMHTDGGAGTALYVNEGSVTSCNFDAVAALSAAQEALIGATAGVVTASTAVIVDANKDAGDFRNLDCVNLDAGASGTVGTVDVFPATAARGKLIIAAVNNDADTNVTLSNAAMGQASVLSFPDPGAATANVLLTDAANDGVVVSATAAEIDAVCDQSARDVVPGTGFDGAGVIEHQVHKIGTLFHTKILIDLTGLNSGGTANDIIGEDSAANCHFGQITAATHGTIIAGKVKCFESPATGDADIDIYSSTDATGTEDADVTGLAGQAILVNGGSLTAGQEAVFTALPAANSYLYLAGATGGDATYTAGIFLIEFWGR